MFTSHYFIFICILTTKLQSTASWLEFGNLGEVEFVDGKDGSVDGKGPDDRHTESTKHVSPSVLPDQALSDTPNGTFGSGSVAGSRLNVRLDDIHRIVLLGHSHIRTLTSSILHRPEERVEKSVSAHTRQTVSWAEVFEDTRK